MPGYTVLLVDLGDVLCTWDSSQITAFPGSTLVKMMNSPVWHEFEQGRLEPSEAYSLLGAHLGIEPQLVEKGLSQVFETLRVRPEFMRVLEGLKARIPELRLYIASNIPMQHFNRIREMSPEWSIFTSFFVSAAMGMRKPELRFFQHMVDEIGRDAKQMLFLDDKEENLCAARSLGIHGVLVKKGNLPDVYQLLQNELNDPVSRSKSYLQENAGQFDSVIQGKDMHFKDNYSQFLIWSATGDPNLVYLKWPSGHFQSLDIQAKNGDTSLDSTSKSVSQSCRELFEGEDLPLWNYFCGKHTLYSNEFPPDYDTTSLAYLTLPERDLDVPTINEILDMMADDTSPDGILHSYPVQDRPSTCPVVCTMLLRMFYRFGRGEDVRIRATEDWVIQCLRNRACNEGTRHYSTPECFYYYLALLYKDCDSTTLQKTLGVLLRRALLERLHISVNPMALAMRINACQLAGIDEDLVKPELDTLRGLQEADGGWPAGHFCRFGKAGYKIGNRGVTTALAMRALEG